MDADVASDSRTPVGKDRAPPRSTTLRVVGGSPGSPAPAPAPLTHAGSPHVTNDSSPTRSSDAASPASSSSSRGRGAVAGPASPASTVAADSDSWTRRAEERVRGLRSLLTTWASLQRTQAQAPGAEDALRRRLREAAHVADEHERCV